MHAWLCENPTGIEALTWKELPTPAPKPGEVLIAIRAASLNFPDLLIVQNKYQMKPALPFVPGSEYAGVVVQVGEGVSHLKPGQNVEFNVSAYPKVNFQGKINFIGAAVREASRDLLVEAAVDNQDGRLKPGLFAEARLSTGDEKALAVPAKALRIDGTKRRLYIIHNNQLEERLVDIGESQDDWVEIRQGVSEGESVVLNPGPGAADGVPVVSKP